MELRRMRLARAEQNRMLERRWNPAAAPHFDPDLFGRFREILPEILAIPNTVSDAR